FMLYLLPLCSVFPDTSLFRSGGEALYADMGHFGARPIRLAWYAVVLPALVLNYFGQGAWLLDHPEALTNPLFNPFYQLVPAWALDRKSTRLNSSHVKISYAVF